MPDVLFQFTIMHLKCEKIIINYTCICRNVQLEWIPSIKRGFVNYVKEKEINLFTCKEYFNSFNIKYNFSY